MKLIKNTRFYKWNGDILEEVKVVRIQNDTICSIVTTKGENIGERRKIEISVLESGYTKLRADGYLSFDIVTVGKNLKDAMVVISRDKDIQAGAKLPFAVCRQCVVDLFAKQLSPDHVDYSGISISQDSCPADVEFENYLACNGVVLDETIAYYIGDTLYDILSVMKNTSLFDDALLTLFKEHCLHLARNNKFIAKEYEKKPDADGYCKSLKQLLEMNNFEYDLYRAFDIIPTNLSKDHFNETLSTLANKVLSSILCVQIDKSIVIKYDKDINFEEIKRKYCLVSDNEYNVYVVGYTISGTYHVPLEQIETDENIEKLGSMLSSESVQLAYQHLLFRQEKYK